jgi:uncharacterized SAM-binding protein YcdF (DUF218 family)
MDLLIDLLVPSGAALLLYVLGLLARVQSRTRAWSWWLLASSGAVTIVFSSGAIAAALMSPLEYSAPVLESPERHSEVQHIVVLTAWGSDDADVPLVGRLNASSLYRTTLALELYQKRPDCKVVISGSATAARLMRDVLVRFGVPPQMVELEDASRSTAASAINLAAMLQDEPFFLVTSAGHMPRSLAVLRKQGLEPIPAPIDHQLPKDWRDAELMPRPATLVVSDLAVHEMLGLLWYRLRDRA